MESSIRMPLGSTTIFSASASVLLRIRFCAHRHYVIFLRHHFGGYYYDLVLYASPVEGVDPPAQVA